MGVLSVVTVCLCGSGLSGPDGSALRGDRVAVWSRTVWP